MTSVADTIDAITDRAGRWASWLVLGVIVLLFGQLPLREVFGGGHILANDLGQLFHASVFMFGLSYALRHDRHVRMDVFYRRMSRRARAAIDLVGMLLFVLPWCGLMLWFGGRYAASAVRALETFPDTWSPGYFLFKVLLMVCFALLALQAIALVLRSLVTLTTPTTARPARVRPGAAP